MTRKFFERSGSFAVAGSRWLPLLPEAISCLAGLSRMHFGKYSIALLCGTVPMAFAYASLAEISEEKWVPRLISIVLPVPIWWIAGRLLHLKTKEARTNATDSTDASVQDN